MSLPPKAVPKSAAAAGSGPGTGPSPSSQLRATLTTVPLPGPPVAQQPPAVPPTQIPRVQQPLDERIFSAQPGVTAVYSVQRPPGPPYSAHELGKGHPNLAVTPPGHASSPGLSQVSVSTVSTAHLYGHPKVWESGGVSPYASGQNAGTTPLVYSPPTQPMNAQPQSRPFFQRPPMQTARPTIPSSNPSIRPASQTPTAAVYNPNQPIMMAMTPMPFPSPQAAQYYIPQYRHSAPQYVGPPQQYSVQPAGPSTFYPGHSPGDFTAQYAHAAGPPYYPGQAMYTPSPPIIVPTPQQPPPVKREKKTIRIRDPNQGGKDITEEIMSGVGGSRNPTPPVRRPSSTPTPPQQLSSQVADHGHAMYSVDHAQLLSAPVDLKPDDKPKPESAVLKSSSPGPRLADPPAERRDPASPAPEPSPPPERPELAPAPAEDAPSPAPPAPEPEGSEPGSPPPEPAASPAPPPEVADGPAGAASPCGSSDPRPPEAPGAEPEAEPPEARAESPAAATETIATAAIPAAAIPAAAPAPPPGLTHPDQAAAEAGAESPETRPETVTLEEEEEEEEEVEEVEEEVEEEEEEEEVEPQPQQQSNTRNSSSQAEATPSAPKTWKKPKEEEAPVVQVLCPDREEEETVDAAPEPGPRSPSPPPVEVERPPPAPEENGEQDAEPLRNGAEHASETESSDGRVTPARSDASADALAPPLESDGKRQYKRDFLLGFQFMPACVQKPDGLPPISDVVLDKINQNKLPTRSADPRVISRGPDFTPAFADFGRQITGGRGAPLLNVGLRRPPPRKIIMNVSVIDEVQLKKAEHAWKPGMKRASASATDDPESQDTQELFRKVRSILNKLTPQMFNQLMKQVTELTIDTEERLKGVIDLVFEKAIDEPSFSVAYANMCRCLTTLKVPMAGKANSTVNFRKLLLNRCQKEFERDKVDDVVFEKKQKELEAAASSSEREHLQVELEEAKVKARLRSIGNIRFIGELFKLKMLTEAIMHDCVVKLLKNHDEESLECLCRLLTTIGKDLDFEKAKPRMDQYFNQMEKIVKERKTSSRIRFMLQDIIDLRLHNWVSRRADQGPKTIEQIHKEAKIEEQEEQRKVHQQLLSKDNKRRPVVQRDVQREVQREETWNTVPMTKNSRTIDPTKFPKISKPALDEKIQLGPRASLNWVKGSSGGAGAKASESDVSRSSGSSLNRYSALQASSPPSATPDSDSRRSLSSRGSSGRERNDKPLSSGPSRPGPFSLASSAKEAPGEPPPEEACGEAPGEPPQEEACGEAPDTPKLQGSTEDKAKPERSRSRDSVKLEAPPGLAPDTPALSEEEMERRSKAIIDEFLHINDYAEAVQCAAELDQAPMLHVFVRVGVESTLERSQITRDHMGQLLYQLVQSGTLSKPLFFKGFVETLELADDMAIDIPHIWLYLAELVIPMFREGGISMRELFSEFSKPLLPVGRAALLFSEILHLLCKQMSHRKVGALWRESGLSWADFLPETEDARSFVADQKLDFTVSDGPDPADALSKKALAPEELDKQLEKLLLEDMAGDEQIFDWVEANLDESEMSLPPFLRALMTAVCKAAVKCESSSSRVDTATIQKRLPVLLKYLNSDTERQLQALYALQALIVKLDQPPNLLRMFFDCLYDEDVISEDAFYKWETSKDPAEQLGKGVALKSVTAFFTWLREAEEESEDN